MKYFSLSFIFVLPIAFSLVFFPKFLKLYFISLLSPYSCCYFIPKAAFTFATSPAFFYTLLILILLLLVFWPRRPPQTAAEFFLWSLSGRAAAAATAGMTSPPWKSSDCPSDSGNVELSQKPFST